MQRLRFSSLVSLLFLMMLLAGCGGGASQASNPPSPTATATAIPLSLTPSSNLSSIAMLSAAEGWAVGYEGASGPAILLHWLKGAWHSEPLPAITIVPQVITMVSPTDGWLGGADSPHTYGDVHGVMLHYSGGSWTQVPLPPDAGPIAGIAMVSSTEGWAVDTTSADHGHAQILHYSQGAWSVAMTGADYTSFTSIAMVSPTEGWAAGPLQPGGYLWHYAQGAWKQIALNDPNQADLEYLSMLSPDDGWGIGGYLTAKQQKDEATPHMAGALWHYTGGQWQVVQQYQDAPDTHFVQLFALQAAAPGDVWVSESDGGSGPHFLHEINGAWQKVAAPIRQSITSIALVSANEGWAVGTAGQMLHYLNGAWIDYPTGQ